MPSPKDIKKLLNVARGEKTAGKALDLDELLGRLPKGTREQQLEAELMFKRLAEEKAALYAPTNPPTEKGKAALRDIKNQLRESGKQKFLEPSQVKQRLYHGTNKEIKEFDPKLIGTNDFGWYGPGHYLSADPGTASAYADYEKVLESGKLQANPSEGANVLPLHVQLRNPYYWPEDRPVARSKEESLAIGNELMSQGYDGVVVPNKYQSPEYAEHHEVVVFDPRRIKSAIGNQGAYDIESPDITKAEGGVAHMAKGGKLLKALRKGEQGVEAGKDLQSMVEAARPVTAAERAAAGKLMTEYTASQPTTRMSEALGNVGAEGKKLRVTQADRTAAKYLGGPPFSGLQLIDPRYAEARATWGVKTPGAAKNIANQSDADILWSTLIGSPFQHKSNEIVFDKLYKAFQKEAKAGNLNEELRAKFNAALEPHFGEGADILDPSLRKEIDTFEKRAIVADLLMGEKLGGALRGGSIIPGGKIMMESTEPMLQGVDTFSIGPRLFTLDRGVTTRPDLHPAFPEILQGEDLRQLFTPVPNEIALPTFNEEFRKRTGRKKPGYYDLTMTPPGEPYPTQDITEKYLSRLQKEGYADGGVVHMQGGGNPGEVSGDMFKPKPLEMPSIFADAAAKLKAQFEKERRSMRKPGAVQDVLMRGPVAMYAGAPADILGMGGEALDYLQTKIPGLRERASVMDTGPERVPTMGYAPKVSMAPEGPYGTEAAQDLLKKAGLTTDEERPLFEMGAGITAPIAGAAALKTGKALAPTARDMLEMQLEKSMKPYQMAVAPEGKAGKVKAPANKVGFYNPAEKAALNLQRKKGPGSAFVSDMQKTPGVNQERLNDLGLGDLASRPDVTRDEILQAAEQNRIPLRESVRRQYQEEDEFSDTLEGLRFNNRYYEDGIQQMQDRIREVAERAPDSPLIAEYERKMALMQEKIERNNERMASRQPSLYGPDSHPDYNMPGGENYREIRVQLPVEESKKLKVVKHPTKEGYALQFENGNFVGRPDAPDAIGTVNPSFANNWSTAEDAKRFGVPFHQNAFMHTTHHGDEPNVLFHLRVADHTDVEGKRGLLIDELQSDWHQAGREHGYKSGKNELPEGWTVDEDPSKNGMWIVRNNRGQMVSTGLGKFDAIESALGSKGGVPNAPFKDNWYQLGLKRAIKEAADTGMDRVYLTTGALQADRYDLSKHIDELVYQDGTLHAYKNGQLVIDKTNVPQDKLQDYVGKEAAKKLIDQKPNEYGTKSLGDLDLQVGGEGMKQYYDKTYKNYLDKYAKQHGGKLGETSLGNGEVVYYIDINDAMRNSAKKGQSYKDGGSVSQDGAAPQDLTAHLNNLLRQHHGMAEGGAVNLEEKLNNLLRQHHGMAEGGEVEAPYNADPDMSDGGLFVPAAAFAEGGAVKSIWTVN
jgi:hypothetical protein